MPVISLAPLDDVYCTPSSGLHMRLYCEGQRTRLLHGVVSLSLQHKLAASVGIVRDKAGVSVVYSCWVTSGAALCVERRKLTAGKPEY